MIAVAKILMCIGFVLGVIGIVALPLVAWWHDRRGAHVPLLTPRRKRTPRVQARFDSHSVITHHHGRHA